MSAKKRQHSNRRPTGRSATQVRVRRVEDDVWELLHPRCAEERAEDIEEVQRMIEGGESDVAADELRWLLGGCHDMIIAHRLLGELAAADGEVPLARGHFGIAFHLGTKAAEGIDGKLPYRLPANQAMHEAGKGLVWCLLEQGKREMAEEVVEQILRFDPDDPLEVRRLLS